MCDVCSYLCRARVGGAEHDEGAGDGGSDSSCCGLHGQPHRIPFGVGAWPHILH